MNKIKFTVGPYRSHYSDDGLSLTITAVDHERATILDDSVIIHPADAIAWSAGWVVCIEGDRIEIKRETTEPPCE